MPTTVTHTATFASTYSDFKQITKAGLSASVVFSSVAGYLLGAGEVSWRIIALLSLGGYFMVGASNVFNQIIERNLDALMKRTQNRPIPTGRISVPTAWFIGITFVIAGISLLYVVNPKTAMFSALSVILYVGLYTPLKTRTPLSVFVGAFPGAIPFMLGWVAATNDFGIEAGTLFMIQFFWQFPHFWAIGWLLDDDYKKAGFKLLPTGKRDKATAIQIIMYILWMMLAAVFPAFGFTGALKLSVGASILVTLSGFVMLGFAIKLYEKQSHIAARQLMFASVIYITVIQVIFVADKWIRLWI
ncbi:heme o synthase [Capnocytophaga canimorsus]|uniref:Protoheme IX farnesyltransferase n=1 Tax=Capnocytophaga canimorsus TaxID=28188 RepID=A0A250G404_9FLAO|nr:heme o synthase [Capnocytophaga canimorsus]ATA92064.1 protoheme IX farnesyltransferase [Capnocytophaga canimorsus]